MADNQLENLEKKIDTISESIKNNSDVLDACKSKAENLEKKFDEVGKEITNFDKSISENSKLLNDENEKIEDLNKNIAATATKIDTLDNSVNKNTTVVNGCKDKIDENSKNIKQLSDEIKKQNENKRPLFFNVVKDKDTNIHSFFLTEENPFPLDDEIIKSKRFLNETDLKSVALSTNLKTVETDAFKNCTELKEVYFKELIDINEENADKGSPQQNDVLVSVNNENQYAIEIKKDETRTYRKLYPDLAKNNLTIQREAFMNCTKLHTLVLPPCKHLSIEKSAFENCTELRTVLILCETAEIQETAFSGCGKAIIVSDCDSVLSFARNHSMEFIDVR